MKLKRFFKILIIGVGLLLLILVVRTFTTKGGQFGEKVAIVDIVGAISKSDKLIEQIHRFRDDQTVKAIVVRIDSPGGSVGAVQEIHTEFTKLEKPVVASMGNTAASGGYYIACAADQIVANRGTITGSIGVILRFMKLKGLYEKVGLEDQVVKSGEFKDTGSPGRGLTDAERALLQDTIDDVHSQFVDAVFEGRKAHLAREEIATLADGRIFSGQQALEYKLVDVLGNLPDAIKLAGTLGGISGKPKVIRDKRKVPLIERILGNTSQQYLDRFLSDPGISFRYEFDLGLGVHQGVRYTDEKEILINKNPVKNPPLYTKNEVVKDILENLSEDDKANIRNTSKDELILFHHGLGTFIRNYYQMWHNQKLIKDIGKEHPDDASMVIIEAVWEILQGSEGIHLEKQSESEVDTTVFATWNVDKKYLEIGAGGTSIVLECIDLDFAQAIAKALKTNLIQSSSIYVHPDVAPQEIRRKCGVVIKLWKWPAHPDNR